MHKYNIFRHHLSRLSCYVVIASCSISLRGFNDFFVTVQNRLCPVSPGGSGTVAIGAIDWSIDSSYSYTAYC